MPIEIKLLDHSHDPVRSLYVAYRTAYSALKPADIDARIEEERITRQQMLDFVEKRLETGHSSPLEQVWFEFAISGVTRAFSHQFVRHRIGISFEQQSQRYVAFKEGEFPYTLPESVRAAGLAGKMESAFGELGRLYQEMLDAGVPAEDARFLIPNAAQTNFKITVNFQSLLHICDLRLCMRAQWEFRRVAALMRAEVKRDGVAPELARYLQPKCGERRTGYCDESFEDWERCPIGRKRPHKRGVFEGYKAFQEYVAREERERERDRQRRRAKRRQQTQREALFTEEAVILPDLEYLEQKMGLGQMFLMRIEELKDEDFAAIERSSDVSERSETY